MTDELKYQLHQFQKLFDEVIKLESKKETYRETEKFKIKSINKQIRILNSRLRRIDLSIISKTKKLKN